MEVSLWERNNLSTAGSESPGLLGPPGGAEGPDCALAPLLCPCDLH